MKPFRATVISGNPKTSFTKMQGTFDFNEISSFIAVPFNGGEITQVTFKNGKDIFLDIKFDEMYSFMIDYDAFSNAVTPDLRSTDENSALQPELIEASLEVVPTEEV